MRVDAGRLDALVIDLTAIFSSSPLYAPYEGSAEEVNIIGRIPWFAREI